LMRFRWTDGTDETVLQKNKWKDGDWWSKGSRFGAPRRRLN